ncbi:MAG: FKBP-type peptidyl-prolyl cis-trans isomerase [Cyclobacteriaceae bacterium]|nr:FKBP-type peptidyl-prolyl cis-trans isomerase [Cyclobacteriaceae bacterium]
MKKNILALLVSIIGLLSCNSKEECKLSVDTSRVDQTQLLKDIETIDAFLVLNNITAIEDESGLRYVIQTQGEGIQPELCNTVQVNYSGHLLESTTVFDANDGVSFPLSNLILGWQVAFSKIKSGTSATLYIPSGLGYGSSGAGNSIPPNANLVFEIDLLNVL